MISCAWKSSHCEALAALSELQRAHAEYETASRLVVDRCVRDVEEIYKVLKNTLACVWESMSSLQKELVPKPSSLDLAEVSHEQLNTPNSCTSAWDVACEYGLFLCPAQCGRFLRDVASLSLERKLLRDVARISMLSPYTYMSSNVFTWAEAVLGVEIERDVSLCACGGAWVLKRFLKWPRFAEAVSYKIRKNTILVERITAYAPCAHTGVWVDLLKSISAIPRFCALPRSSNTWTVLEALCSQASDPKGAREKLALCKKDWTMSPCGDAFLKHLPAPPRACSSYETNGWESDFEIYSTFAADRCGEALKKRDKFDILLSPPDLNIERIEIAKAWSFDAYNASFSMKDVERDTKQIAESFLTSLKRTTKKELVRSNAPEVFRMAAKFAKEKGALEFLEDMCAVAHVISSALWKSTGACSADDYVPACCWAISSSEHEKKIEICMWATDVHVACIGETPSLSMNPAYIFSRIVARELGVCVFAPLTALLK